MNIIPFSLFLPQTVSTINLIVVGSTDIQLDFSTALVQMRSIS